MVRSSSTPLPVALSARSRAASAGSLTCSTTRASSDAPSSLATRACSIASTTQCVPTNTPALAGRGLLGSD